MQWFMVSVLLWAVGAESPKPQAVGAGREVDVQTLRGTTRTGKLVELNQRQIVLETATGRESLDTTTLASVQLHTPAGESPPASAADSGLVTLVDGSTLAVVTFRVRGSSAQVGLAGGGQLELPTRAVRSVRFRPQEPEVQQLWDELLQSPSSADRLVVRKTVPRGEGTGEQPPTVRLDQLDGVLYDLDDKTVAFEFDGSRMQVPREKLEGIIYHLPALEKAQQPICRISDTFGSMWNATSAQWREERIELTTANGARYAFPAGQLAKIDFSIGNLLFLTDLRPESVQWRPYVQSESTPPSLAKWFQPRWDSGMYGGPLMLGEKAYERGLALHSRTEIIFRLSGDYQRFLATVGVDDRFRNVGNVQLVIATESASLFSKTISGNDSPFELDIDIRGVRRLRILVDFGDDRSDSGDHLNLCNARLMK